MTDHKEKRQFYPPPAKSDVLPPEQVVSGPSGTLERLLSVYSLFGDMLVSREEVILQKARALAALVAVGRGEQHMTPYFEAGALMNVTRIFEVNNKRVEFGLANYSLAGQDVCAECGSHVTQGTCKITRRDLSLPSLSYSVKDDNGYSTRITRPRIIFTLLPYASFHLLADHETYEGGFERSGTIVILPARIEDFFTKPLEELGDMEELMKTMAEPGGAFHRTYTQEQPR